MKLTDVVIRLAGRAKAFDVTIEKYAAIAEDAKAEFAEKSDPETRDAAKRKIHEWYNANPEAEADIADLCREVGLKNTNADKSFVNHQMKVLRSRTSAVAAE